MNTVCFGGRICRSSLFFLALAMIGAPAAFAQSNTAVGSGQTAQPVLIGNNVPAAGTPSSSDSRNTGASPWSLFSSGDTGSTNKGPSFAELNSQTSATMTANSDKFAAIREKQLAQNADDERAAYDRKMAAAHGKNGQNGTASGQQTPVTMQYQPPTDADKKPARTFSLE